MRCNDDEQCSIPRARSSLIAKTKMMFFGGSCNGSHGGWGGGWVGG